MEKNLTEKRQKNRKRNQLFYHNRKDYFQKYWQVNGKKIVEKRRSNLFECLGEPICKRCGFSDTRALQIDHINGGGSKYRKQNNSWCFLLKEVKKNPNDFQILCANCNWIKRFENHEVTGRPKKDQLISN